MLSVCEITIFFVTSVENQKTTLLNTDMKRETIGELSLQAITYM